MFRTVILAASVALLAPLTAARTPGDEPLFDLMVGDPAPPLTVEWIKGEPIQSFRDDHTYVVEFWATWCGPCIRAMPHLSELQHEYADRKVRFVGVNIWEEDQSKVPAFVEKMGEKMDYTVAMDILLEAEEGARPIGKMATAWMDAAGRNGIPSSFIVKGGRVQWIGHPGEMDEPLADVVAGTWDLAAAAKKHRDAVAGEAAMKRLQDELRAAMTDGDWSAALAAIERAVETQPAMERSLAPQKLYCLARKGDAKGAEAYARELETGAFATNPQGLNFIAMVVTDPENADLGLDPEIGVRVAKKANELTQWKEPVLLATYATTLSNAGDHAKAIEMQEKAVELSAGSKAEASQRARLEELRQKQRS